MAKPGFYEIGRQLGAALLEDDLLFARLAERAGLDRGPYLNRICDESPWTGGGKNECPSDILVLATAQETGRRWGIHLRNLVRTAKLNPEQAADYPKRAEAMAGLRGYDAWRTVLVVERTRLAKVDAMTAPFDAILFHHEISDRVPIYSNAL